MLQHYDPFQETGSIPAILIIDDDREIGQALRCLVSSVMRFFTLTQIAFLVYTYRGAAAKDI
jgi:hypothetical protein